MNANHHAYYLNAAPRTEFNRSSLRRLRQDGRVPAVIYGAETENLAVHVDVKELLRVVRTGRTEFFDLKVEGGQVFPALIKEIQQHNGKIVHVDFQQVTKNKPIRVKMPVHLIGTAKGTKVGGVLQIQETELEVEGLPDILPASLDVDISSLDAGDKLLAGDVRLPDGVVLHSQADELLASIVLPRSAEADAARNGDEEPAGAEGAGE
ncbi:50S ribosomal protein L25 [Paenibacillus macerans]|uniref:Large ribosomal subunit protein bL25 n=1 Tax=Paenibacillus macerans TaxID=44252 RepID=A0A090ZKW0_PAEMA|nr:50S ribosomal protein L25 [Paenibacillus macerans]KFN11257.1 ribosomal protein L25, Ctc-form [Paenibacillus macerans]MBS5911527.1 50S ribosomal protein L25 [Paenibacillus macerans]MCY7560286.1 50S ribosomal protein L25 [Paenibacillus macerans]MDU5945941.1 50S ribosomal protein L25 [Paenibacillus macerans]MEC0141548.1 50S ribosomal protein L25 [Paenibacillus macerans]